jgi:translation initiation factor 1 (eIF-1/SUI1)
VSGECKKIQIRATKGKRQNNTITFVAFYQSFGIDGETFVKEAQKKFGCRYVFE